MKIHMTSPESYSAAYDTRYGTDFAVSAGRTIQNARAHRIHHRISLLIGLIVLLLIVAM